jgi:hypothetical protein
MEEEFKFAIHTDFSMEDFKLIESLLAETVKRGTWTIAEIPQIIELHTRVGGLINAFNEGEE